MQQSVMGLITMAAINIAYTIRLTVVRLETVETYFRRLYELTAFSNRLTFECKAGPQRMVGFLTICAFGSINMHTLQISIDSSGL